MSIATVCGTGNFAYRSRVVEHLLGGVAGGARVPQAEARDAVGVHVLGGPLQLGEDGELVPRVVGVGVRDFEQHGAVALHDQGPVRNHNRSA